MSKDVSVRPETTIFVRDTCLCLHVRRAARVLSRRFDEAFRPLGINNGQFSLMMSLNRPDRPTMSAVADFLAMDRTTLTAALKPLERRGLVRVDVDGLDKRNRRLSLSDDGRGLLAKAMPIWRETHAEIEVSMGENDPQIIRAGLAVLT